MFQTSLISLLCYLYLLSPKFCDECHRHLSSSCCDLILWSQLYENLITFLSLFSLYSSTYNLFMLKSPIKSKGFSRHTHLVILQWLLPSTLISSGVIVSCYFWWWFVSLPLRVFRPNLGTRFFLGGKAVTVRVLVMLDIYFVSVKHMFVCIKLMCVYVKLLKI
jgi:hypothetical protein